MPPNGFANRAAVVTRSNSNPLGLDTPPAEIETTPEHYNLIGGDPGCAGWTRSYDDPNVVALREKLWKHNGISGLQVLDPTEVERAAELFHRDGFVVDPRRVERRTARIACARPPNERSTRCWRSIRPARRVAAPAACRTATRSAAARRRGT